MIRHKDLCFLNFSSQIFMISMSITMDCFEYLIDCTYTWLISEIVSPALYFPIKLEKEFTLKIIFEIIRKLNVNCDKTSPLVFQLLMMIHSALKTWLLTHWRTYKVEKKLNHSIRIKFYIIVLQISKNDRFKRNLHLFCRIIHFLAFGQSRIGFFSKYLVLSVIVFQLFVFSDQIFEDATNTFY